MQITKEPTERKIIIVVDDVLKNKARDEEKKWSDVEFCKQHNTVVVNVDDDYEGDLFKKLKEKSLLQPGNTLLQDPYDTDRYMVLKAGDEQNLLDEVQNLLLNSANERWLRFNEIVNALGVKQCICVEEQTQTENKNTTVTHPYGSAKMDIKSDMMSKYRLELKSPGHTPNKEMAKTLLVKYHLEDDSALNSLINMRCNQENPLKEFGVDFQVCTEMSKVFELAIDINVPSLPKVPWLKKIFGGLNLKRTINNNKKSYVSFKLIF